MRIPASFKLMGHTITVRDVPIESWQHGEDCVGQWLPAENAIDLRGDQSGTVREQIFFHELQHAVLGMMGSKLTDNEVFVDQSASLWHQALSTAKYPRRKRSA